jgi:hypothetical protein
MTKHIFYYLAFALVAFSACEYSSSATTTATTLAPPVESAPTQVSEGPATEELLNLLRGRWQNEEDAAYVLDIRNGFMKRMLGSQILEESELQAFSNCDSIPCTTEKSAAPGWCFTETSANDEQCHRVVKCDNSLLQFETVGKSELFKFKKIQP